MLGDLSLRRAVIVKVLPREDMKLIIADVPLACLMVSWCGIIDPTPGNNVLFPPLVIMYNLYIVRITPQ